MSVQDCIGSYIVRIYDRAAAGSEAFVGVVQDIEGGGSFPFKSPSDLWSILTAERRESRAQTEDGGN